MESAGTSMQATDLRTQKEWQSLRAASPQPLFPVSSAAPPDRAILKTVTLEGAAAQDFLGLWRTQRMDCERTDFPLCRDPYFAVSFFAGQQILLEVSLCWWCQDARFSVGSEEIGCDFVVGTAEARALRRLLKGYFPGVSNGEDRVLSRDVQ